MGPLPTRVSVRTVETPRTARWNALARGALQRAWHWIARNAYLGLVVGALLVITRTVTFTPPNEVRVGTTDAGQVVGDAARQEFSTELANPQAVQVRATLRRYVDNELVVSVPDPEMDRRGQLLSQPVVTTILGMSATVEQTVRLEDGALEVDLTVHATPRLRTEGKDRERLELETEIRVASRRRPWFTGRSVQRVNLDSRGFLAQVEDRGHRVVFTVDQHLFSLDLELARASRFGSGETLAKAP